MSGTRSSIPTRNDTGAAIADKVWYKQPGMHLSYTEADPVYPFQRIKYTDGSDTGIMMIAAPFYDTNYYRQPFQLAALSHSLPPPCRLGWSSLTNQVGHGYQLAKWADCCSLLPMSQAPQAQGAQPLPVALIGMNVCCASLNTSGMEAHLSVHDPHQYLRRSIAGLRLPAGRSGVSKQRGTSWWASPPTR